MPDRSATSLFFGIDFQVNAAIVLMLANIQEMKTIRLEKGEDIAITLNDDSSILAQAKSVVKSSTDFKHVIPNLNKALLSLAEESNKISSVRQLIYITNTPRPIGGRTSNTIFSLNALRKYDTLPSTYQKTITDILATITNPLDLDKFYIQILPFETDEDEERYKYVAQKIENFIRSLNLGIYSISTDVLHGIWRNDVFKSGTKQDQDITITKKGVIWPIIVHLIENKEIDDPEIDDSDAIEIINTYSTLINNCAEQFEFTTDVLSAYYQFKEGDRHDRPQLFVQSKYKDYMYLLDNVGIQDVEIKRVLVQVILRNIISRNKQIGNIKQAVNL